MSATGDDSGLTQGTLLGGQVRYTQAATGYRTGIEPVLLAAAIPARAGDRVLEAGTGAGAGLLCLAARVPGLVGVGIERHAPTAALARLNLVANGAPFEVLTADVADLPPLAPFDHIFANPPWHHPQATRPPDPWRADATHREADTIPAWIGALSGLLAPRGTMTLILPAALSGEAITCFVQARLARLALLPLWPRAGTAAKIVLLHAKRGQPCTAIMPGLVLHGPGSGYTAAADTILRAGASLPVGTSLPIG